VPGDRPLPWPAFDALKHQYEAQRDIDLDRIELSDRRLVKLT
jgi:hypothetical protein